MGLVDNGEPLIIEEAGPLVGGPSGRADAAVFEDATLVLSATRFPLVFCEALPVDATLASPRLFPNKIVLTVKVNVGVILTFRSPHPLKLQHHSFRVDR